MTKAIVELQCATACKPDDKLLLLLCRRFIALEGPCGAIEKFFSESEFSCATALAGAGKGYLRSGRFRPDYAEACSKLGHAIRLEASLPVDSIAAAALAQEEVATAESYWIGYRLDHQDFLARYNSLCPEPQMPQHAAELALDICQAELASLALETGLYFGTFNLPTETASRPACYPRGYAFSGTGDCMFLPESIRQHCAAAFSDLEKNQLSRICKSPRPGSGRCL